MFCIFTSGTNYQKFGKGDEFIVIIIIASIMNVTNIHDACEHFKVSIFFRLNIYLFKISGS